MKVEVIEKGSRKNLRADRKKVLTMLI